MLEGTHRSESGRDIEYQVEFTVEGNSIVWSGRARLHGSEWTDIPGGVDKSFDPGFLAEEVHALMHAAIDDMLRGEAG